MSISSMEVSLYPGFTDPKTVAQSKELRFVALKGDGDVAGRLVLSDSTMVTQRHSDMMGGNKDGTNLLGAGVIKRNGASFDLRFASTELDEAGIAFKPKEPEAKDLLAQQINAVVRAWIAYTLATEVIIT